MKLLIIGHGRHGKDQFAEYLREMFGMTYQSSSEAAADIFLFDALKDKYGYKDIYECFADRHNHRAEWKELITDYNTPNKARLATKIIERNDCYVGMRCGEEISACLRARLFDLVIWVDALDRLPPEGQDSFDIDQSFADVVINNNYDLDHLKACAGRLGRLLFNTDPYLHGSPYSRLKRERADLLHRIRTIDLTLAGLIEDDVDAEAAAFVFKYVGRPYSITSEEE